MNIDLGNGIITEGGGQWIGPGQDEIFNLARELGIERFESYHLGKAVYFVGSETVTVDDTGGGIMSENPLVSKINSMAKAVPAAAPLAGADLFTAAEDNWALENLWAQLCWMVPLGQEGGLFVTIGQKQGAAETARPALG